MKAIVDRKGNSTDIGAFEFNQGDSTGSVDPVEADAGSDQEICLGDSVILEASGGSTYRWSTGDTSSQIEVSPGSDNDLFGSCIGWRE